MAIRPFIGNEVYRGMKPSDAVAQYNRDLALYEQAEALKNIQNQQCNITTASIDYEPSTFEIKMRELEKDYNRKDRPKRYGEGSDTNIKYCRLVRQYGKTIIDIKKIYGTINWILAWTFLLNISFGTIGLVCSQSSTLKTIIILIYPMLLIGIIYRNLIVKSYTHKAIRQQENISRFIWENRTYKDVEKEETDKETSKEPVKEVLHLIHNNK